MVRFQFQDLRSPLQYGYGYGRGLWNGYGYGYGSPYQGW
jgi:hypothetical protein